MSTVPTDRRASVRVLLRLPGTSGVSSTQRRMGGYLVIVVGDAKQADWPNARVEEGDVEGISWTTPRQVLTVVENLRKCPGVIDARGVEDDDELE